MVIEGKRSAYIRGITKPWWKFGPEKAKRIGAGSFNLVTKISRGIVVKSYRNSMSSFKPADKDNNDRLMNYTLKIKEGLDVHLRFLYLLLGDLMFRPRIYMDWNEEGDRIYPVVNQIEPNIAVFTNPITKKQIGLRPRLPNEDVFRGLITQHVSLREDIQKFLAVWNFIKSCGLSFDISMSHSCCIYVEPKTNRVRFLIFDLIPLFIEDHKLFENSNLSSRIRSSLIMISPLDANRDRVVDADRFFDTLKDILSK